MTNPGGSAAGATGEFSEASTLQAQLDLATAYNDIVALTPTARIIGDLGGRTITPGIYSADAPLTMSTSFTFDALGDPNAVFIIQAGASLDTTDLSKMILANGAQASRIYWQTAGAVTTGGTSFFIGTILGNSAITAGAGTAIQGRALTSGGAVTLDSTTLLPVPDISLTSSVAPSVNVEAGDPGVFSQVIRNSGNVDLTLNLTTGLPASAHTSIAWPDTRRVLPAGHSVTATTAFVPTLSDAANRSISSAATVIGTPVHSDPVSASSNVTLNVYPTPVVDSIATFENATTSFNVLTNDAGAEIGGTFSLAELGTQPRLIGAAAGPVPSQPATGSVSCVTSGSDRGLCSYRPADAFIGTDTFDYSLSQDSRSWNVHVTITITADTTMPIARDNRVVATVGGPVVTFDPTANSTAPSTAIDPNTGASSGTITIKSSSGVPSAEGSLNCMSTTCKFTPPAGGFTGTTTAIFRLVYTSASGREGTISTPATITIFVDPPSLTPTGFVTADAITTPVSLANWTTTTAISAVTATCLDGRPAFSLSWGASAGTTSWALERRRASSTPGPWIRVVELPAHSTTFTDSDVGQGISYQWQVRPDVYRWLGIFSQPSEASGATPAVNDSGC